MSGVLPLPGLQSLRPAPLLTSGKTPVTVSGPLYFEREGKYMGYTHYWYRPARLDAKKFKQAAQDCKRVCEALNIQLGNGSGKGEPEFSNQAVWFNGAVNSKALMR